MEPNKEASQEERLSDSISEEIVLKNKLASLPANMLDYIDEHGFDLITVYDISGKILYVSNSVTRIFGYKRAELIGKRAMSYLPLNDRTQFKNKFEKHSLSPQKFKVSFRNSKGKYIWVESIISRIKDERLNEDVFISISRDITERKEAEEMFVRHEKLSVAGQLAAGVAHEIRNPLTSLKGFVQLLQAGIERKDEYYKIMVEEIDKIETITSELLYISKPVTDNKQPEHVSEMLNDVIILLQSQANLYSVTITLKMEEDIKVYCDRSQIKQVLINLIKNAIEEMKSGGNIEVKVEKNEQYCTISIIDDGPGIPPHILPKLKEPFFTTKKDGTGLGLMVSTQILTNHKGYLDITSNQDKGSTFKIVLPL